MRRVLACHDAFEETTDAVLESMGSLHEAAEVTLYHVLPPFPPEFLEHQGSEDPHQKEALESRLEAQRRQWIEDRTAEADRVLRPCVTRLREQDPPPASAELKIVPSYVPSDFLPLLKDEVTANDYDEVLIVHHPVSWFKNVLRRSEADRVINELHGTNVRIFSLPKGGRGQEERRDS